MEVMQKKLLARQAILDINLKTIGYELLFRNSLDNKFNGASPEKATSQIVLQNHILGDLSDVCLGKLAFINFDEFTILQNSPLLLSPKSLVVELLETIEITDELVFHISQLHKKHYIVALDNYDFANKWESIFPYISIIKIDIGKVSFSQIVELKNRLLSVKSNIKIVAKSIETQEQFKTLKAMEIDYYQGCFFHEPEMKSGTCVSPLKLNLIQLFLEAYKPNLDFDQLTKIISRDLTLVSGILKLVNGKSECGNIEITSIKQAITYLGTNKIKQYVAIISMSTLSSENPPELFTESIIRGKTMELMSAQKPFSHIRDRAFLTGVLSNLDVILNLSMKEVVDSFPFSQDISLALLNQQGALSELLELAKHYELPNSYNIEHLINVNKIPESTLLECYHESLKWWMSTP